LKGVCESSEEEVVVGGLSIGTGRAVGAGLLTAVVVVVAALAWLVRPRMAAGSSGRGNGPLMIVGGLLLVAGVAAFLGFWRTPVEGVPLILGSAAVVLFTLGGLATVFLGHAYPNLRRALALLVVVLLAWDLWLVVGLHSAIWIPLIAIGYAVFYFVMQWGVSKIRQRAAKTESKRKRRRLSGLLVALASWPLLVIALLFLCWLSWPDLIHVNHGIAGAVFVIGAAELLVVAVVLSGVVWWSLHRARGWAPLLLLCGELPALASSLAVATVLATLLGFPMGYSPLHPLVAGLSVIAIVQVYVGACFWRATDRLEDAEIEQALAARDSGAEGHRRRALHRAMAIAAFPGIAVFAEATEPPFHKSFLVIDLLNPECLVSSVQTRMQVAFSIYAVDEERDPEARGHPAPEPSANGHGHVRAGSFLADRTIVEVSKP
jgi:hypothetical protein